MMKTAKKSSKNAQSSKDLNATTNNTEELNFSFNYLNRKYKKNSKVVAYAPLSKTSMGNGSTEKRTSDDNNNSLTGLKVVTKYFYNCDRCQVEFNSLKEYQSHLQTHNVPLGMLFLVNQRLQKIITSAEYFNNQTEQSITCYICGKAFANTRNLNVHLRLHTGFRPFECEICKRKFTSM